VGYAPLSETEQLVLATEKFLNGQEFKTKFPASGQDIKVMGVRNGGHLDLTVAMPLLDRFVQSANHYFDQLEEIRELLLHHLRSRLLGLCEITVGFNHLDRRGLGLAGMYLSVLGTSAEDADSGEVGRGNQVNGLIALNRPRGSEAAAGKNPVSHVGKIYSVLTHVLAEKIYREVSGVEHVLVWLCSRIGAAVDDPQAAAVQVQMKEGAMFADIADALHEIVERELARMPEFCSELATGKYPVC
jgi:S-adenosylmethionine synthetase